MIERIMIEVRAGKYVCALFYGHRGLCYPSHNAIAIARQEGYDAVMLPAVSAEDCLYADLGVHPSVPGMQIFEATDFYCVDVKWIPPLTLCFGRLAALATSGSSLAVTRTTNLTF